MEVLTPEEEEELDRIEDIIRDKANNNRVSFNSRTQDRYKELKAKQNQMPAPPPELNIDINESFLYMQKLAGLITESEYKAKIKEDKIGNIDLNLVKSFKNKLICNSCGFVDETRSAVFGEVIVCNNCASPDTRFEYK